MAGTATAGPPIGNEHWETRPSPVNLEPQKMRGERVLLFTISEAFRSR